MSKRENEKISRVVEKIAVEVVQKTIVELGDVYDLGLGDGPDFEIKYHDGRIGIGEVGLHEDPDFAEAWAIIHKSDTPQQITLSGGAGYWAVGCSSIPNLKRLHAQLPSLIEALSNEGRGSLEIYGDYPQGENADWARSLGIDYLVRNEQEGIDVAIFFLPSTGGAVPEDPNLIVQWIEEVLLSNEFEDSWRKLLPFETDEKHVFIMTGSRTPFGIDELLKKKATPTRTPDLPGGLTHIWISSRYTGIPGIYWTAQTGWARHFD